MGAFDGCIPLRYLPAPDSCSETIERLRKELAAANSECERLRRKLKESKNMTPPGYKIVKTLDELIHLVAFGDTCEAAFFFRDDKQKNDEFAVEIPLNRPDDDDLRKITPEEEWHMQMLAILVAFRDGRLCKGGYVAQKKKIRRKGKAR